MKFNQLRKLLLPKISEFCEHRFADTSGTFATPLFFDGSLFGISDAEVSGIDVTTTGFLPPLTSAANGVSLPLVSELSDPASRDSDSKPPRSSRALVDASYQVIDRYWQLSHQTNRKRSGIHRDDRYENTTLSDRKKKLSLGAADADDNVLSTFSAVVDVLFAGKQVKRQAWV